ncbi:MAG: 3-deoxy-manno-octulosonate cytidylyltransferase [Parvularculaceae bacterium]|nr:3-deoxy-manno-octulosonate cytidylyltransferase [Parvularculaceae bacterium]
MKAVIIIPARLASTRLARKLLLDLAGKPVLQRTYEQALKSKRADRVIIATDSDEIARAAAAFGAETVMTRADHQSGSERIAQAARSFDAEIIANIQGDEPEIDPAHIDALIEAQEIAQLFASTLACPFPDHIDPAYPAAVKATPAGALDEKRRIFEARDFSRMPPTGGDFFLHIGAYAYSSDSLQRFISLPRGAREKSESLEQLRIIENGRRIALRIVDRAARGIDTIEDLEAARLRLGE